MLNLYGGKGVSDEPPKLFKIFLISPSHFGDFEDAIYTILTANRNANSKLYYRWHDFGDFREGS